MSPRVLWWILAFAAAEPGPTPAAPEARLVEGRRWLFEPRFSAHLYSGAEWDSNARRAVKSNVALLEDASLPTLVVGDAVARLLIDSALDLAITNRDHLRLGLVLGAKRFFRESSEDLLIPELSAATTHQLAERFTLELDGSWRASRIRSGLRDYTLAMGGAGLSVGLTRGLAARIRGGLVGFDFGHEPQLNYQGPSAAAELVWEPLDHLSLKTEVAHYWRAYQGNAFVLVTPPGSDVPVASLCDGRDGLSCSSGPRRDTELSALFRATYRRSFLLGAELLGRFQRSNSALESLDRYRVGLFGTFSLPVSLVLNVMGALQFNRGLSVTQTKYLGVEDDESFNRLEVQLSRKLVPALSAELRYSLYANEFASADVHFFRQAVYGGLSYEFDTDSR